MISFLVLGKLEGVTGILGMDALSLLQAQIDTAQHRVYPRISPQPMDPDALSPTVRCADAKVAYLPAARPAPLPPQHPACSMTSVDIPVVPAQWENEVSICTVQATSLPLRRGCWIHIRHPLNPDIPSLFTPDRTYLNTSSHCPV